MADKFTDYLPTLIGGALVVALISGSVYWQMKPRTESAIERKMRLLEEEEARRVATEAQEETSPLPPPATSADSDRFLLETLWRNGLDAYTEQRFADAFAAWMQGCEMGDAASCGDLGVMFEYGQGIDADPIKARMNYQLACEDDHAQHCVNLARHYRDGLSVEPDATRAQALYRKACALGISTACGELGSLSDPTER